MDARQNLWVPPPRPRAFRPGWLLLVGFLILIWWWLNPPREGACGGIAPPNFSVPRAAPTDLREARVMLNPGHGLSLRDDGSWQFQRPSPDGRSVFVLEDESNLLLARAVRDALQAAGASVLTTRDLDSKALGASGQPQFLEGARAHLERSGMERGVWDSAGSALHGDCRSSQDLRARAYAANAQRADLMVSLHSNAGRPDARGTLVLYASRSYLRAAPPDFETRNACLAKGVATAVPAAIRAARPDLGWENATITASDRYGENGYALMPAVILEVGYHTNRRDGPALRQESFRRAVAAGVVTALRAFLQRREIEGC
jgi:N-acetylmuramoyl-L-alanine amidase